jgi:hypothetical protein
LPRSLTLRKRRQRFVQRVRDDRAHRLVPRPPGVDARLAQQVHERALGLVVRREAVERDHRVLGQVRARRQRARRGGADPERDERAREHARVRGQQRARLGLREE